MTRLSRKEAHKKWMSAFHPISRLPYKQMICVVLRTLVTADVES